MTEWTIVTVGLSQEGDIVLARQRARRIAELLGFDRQDQTRVATAVSEIARNAYAYGRGGKVEYRVESGLAQRLAIVITDTGPGIAQLDDVLSGAYASPHGMGVGITGARRLMDGFEAINPPGGGARITLLKQLPADAARVSGRSIGELAKTLAAESAGDPIGELREANQSLIASLKEVKERQDDLERLNNELEDTNRGVVALYAELDQAAENLKAASEAKSRFLSHVSHEFRTPLNSINALSGLLLDRVDGPLSPEQERQVSYIRKSAETLTDLVNDLLDIAKVEAGKIDVRVEPFEVSELFASLRVLMRPLQGSHSAELWLDDPVGLPTVHSDEAKVSQILRNLISNALKFTEDGEVRVSARQDETGGLAFQVRDNGIGIAPEDQLRIFQEFEQVAGPLQLRAKGTGLGLPLSRRLAELLGGSLTVESTPGAGSCFTLRLPAPARDAAPGPSRVLVVDDEEAFRYALRQMVGKAHEVFEAEDGNAALAQLQLHRPAVVFLDLNMPGMDGYACLEAIGRNPALESLKVIVSTSAIIDQRDMSRLARADVVLGKDQLSRETVAALITGGPD
ncbi:MAG TPA: ATP-binding protein [Caulobacteraceae bacterium]|jgi:signal transduction histidine kinase|nr:ATP-binding protein [Caulobacteraceae bacterium]